MEGVGTDPLDQHCVDQGPFDLDRSVWAECHSRTGSFGLEPAQFGLPSHVIEAKVDTLHLTDVRSTGG